MSDTATLTGAQATLRTLEQLGVEVVFGYPGGAILPAYDALVGSRLRHVLVRHEQGAVHMAEGYANASGRVGVVIATSGPGATNLVTGLANALMDSTPLVAITGQAPSSVLGSDAFQEAPVLAVTAPVTKHNELVTDAARIPSALHEAFHIATSGRPGPVLVDITKDALQQPIPWHVPRPVQLPGYRVPAAPPDELLTDALRLVARSERPVVYAGGGLVRADAAEALRAFVERLHLPVVTTLMARGVLPDGHPLHLGMPGMHGHWTAVTAMQEADLLVALGARFDDRVTGRLDGFAPHARVVHVDIDPSELGKNRYADVAVAGDVRAVLDRLVALTPPVVSLTPLRRAWLAQLKRWRGEHPLRWDESGDVPLKPQTAISAIGARFGGDAVYVAGVGQHQMWAAQLLPFDRPRGWVNSGGLGTMGFAVPAAIGAKLARPGARVVCIDGDGGFQMTMQELATACQYRVPVTFCVVNNGQLGMVRQWQELFYGGRCSQVELPQALPDLVQLAGAYDIPALRVTSAAELEVALDKAYATTDGAFLLDLRVDPGEHVYPMVPAGCSNSDIVECASQWQALARKAG